jgi:hypothetical protein
MEDYSYIGVGKLHLRVMGSSAPLLPVGNCSVLTFNVTETEKTLPDYTQAGGGAYNSMTRIESVGVSMTLHDLSPANIARQVYGNANAVTEAAVVDENVGASYKGGISVTEFPIKTTVAPVVEHAENAATVRADSTAYVIGDYYLAETTDAYVYKCTVAGTSGASEPTYDTTVGDTFTDGTATFRNVGKKLLVVDTDYTATGGGITLTDDASLYDGEELIVNYTKTTGYTIEALLNAAQEYELLFDGLNEARSGKPVIVHAFRVKLGATNGLSLIGEEYYAGEQTGTVLKDTTKNGVSVSQYFKTKIVA